MLLTTSFIAAPAPTGPICSIRAVRCAERHARPRHIRVGAADQRHELALAHGRDGAEHRAVDEGRAARGGTSAASARTVIGCSVLISMKSLPLMSVLRNPFFALPQGPGAGILGDDREHDVGAVGDLARAAATVSPCSRRGPHAGRRRGPRRSTCSPTLAEPRRHRRAHLAQSDKSDHPCLHNGPQAWGSHDRPHRESGRWQEPQKAYDAPQAGRRNRDRPILQGG